MPAAADRTFTESLRQPRAATPAGERAQLLPAVLSSGRSAAPANPVAAEGTRPVKVRRHAVPGAFNLFSRSIGSKLQRNARLKKQYNLVRARSSRS